MPITDRDYAECTELVEAAMEWIGMRWTVSMIKRELRSYFGSHLSFGTCNWIIKAANKLIRDRFNIDPQEYKGIQITFYEGIIRNCKEKTQNQLKAAERLDSLFGLEQISSDDPEIIARKIREELNAMNESMNIEGDDNDGEQRNTNDGDGQVDAGNGEQNSVLGDNSTNKENTSVEDDPDAKKAIEELKNLKTEDLERFRKGEG